MYRSFLHLFPFQSSMHLLFSSCMSPLTVLPSHKFSLKAVNSHFAFLNLILILSAAFLRPYFYLLFCTSLLPKYTFSFKEAYLHTYSTHLKSILNCIFTLCLLLFSNYLAIFTNQLPF